MKKIISTFACYLLIAVFTTPSVFAQKKGKFLSSDIEKKYEIKTGEPVQSGMFEQEVQRKDPPHFETIQPPKAFEYSENTPQNNQQEIHSAFTTTVFDANWKELGPFTNTPHIDNEDNKYYEQNQANLLSLNINPYDPNVMWVATFGSGLWKTWDAGKTWIPISRQSLPGAEITAFAIDSYDPNMIYASVRSHFGFLEGLYKTTDGGSTWWQMQVLTSPLASIIVHPRQNQKILSASNVNLFYSENSGATWATVLTTPFRGNIKLVYSPSNPDIVYVQVSDSTGIKVVKSTNFGKTWQNTGLKNIPNNIHIMDIAVAPTDAQTVYAAYAIFTDSGTVTKILRSTNGGDTWTIQSEGYKKVFAFSLKITVDSDNKDKLYLATYGDYLFPEGVYLSIDGGKTIRIIGGSIKAFSQNPVGIILADMKHHPISKELICTFNYGGAYKVKTAALASADISNLYCAWDDLRIAGTAGWSKNCVSLNNNWVRISDGISATHVLEIAKKGNVILVGGDSGLFKWDGNKWVQITTALYGATPNMAFTDNTNSFFIDEYGALSKTTDGGLIIKNTLPNEALAERRYYRVPLYVSAKNPQIAFSFRSNLWKTTNGGTTWGKIDIPKDTNNLVLGGAAMAISPSNENIIYIATRTFSLNSRRVFNYYIHKSKDGGITWENIKQGLPNAFIDRMLVHPTNPEQLWIVFQGRLVYSSSDGGKNWVNISEGLPTVNTTFRAIAYDDVRNVLYIGTDKSVFIKTGNNTPFRPYNIGLPNIGVFDLELDTQEGKIYAGTSGAGLWVGDLYGFIIPSNAVTNKTAIALNSMMSTYPNPVQNKLSINITPKNDSEWSIRLLNSIGQTIYTQNGQYHRSVEINTEDIENGLYLLEYQSNGERRVEKVLVQH